MGWEVHDDGLHGLKLSCANLLNGQRLAGALITRYWISAEIFPWRREHLDLLRVLNDLYAVLDVRRDSVGVIGTQFVS